MGDQLYLFIQLYATRMGHGSYCNLIYMTKILSPSSIPRKAVRRAAVSG